MAQKLKTRRSTSTPAKSNQVKPIIFPDLSNLSSSREVSDRWVFPLPIPVTRPRFLEQIIQEDASKHVTELWEASIRLEVALGLVRSLPKMVEMRDRISTTAQDAIAEFFPELGSLKALLDAVSNSFPLPGSISRSDPRFPEAEFRVITGWLPLTIEQDATTLEQAGAIDELRTEDGLPFWSGIHFEVTDEDILNLSTGAGASNSLIIGTPYRTHLHSPVLAEVLSFRARLERSPTSTLASLPRPIHIILKEPVLGQRTSARHSKDFTTVDWFGTKYYFNVSQSLAVKELWEAWEAGVPGVGQDLLLEKAGCESVRNLFKGHPAWNTMIVSRPKMKGVYELIPPTPGQAH